MSPIILLSSSFTSFSPLFYPCESHFFISLGNVTSENCSGIKVAGCLRKKYITFTVGQSKSVHHATVQFRLEQFSAIRLDPRHCREYMQTQCEMLCKAVLCTQVGSPAHTNTEPNVRCFAKQRSAISVIPCSAGENDLDPPWQHELLIVPL